MSLTNIAKTDSTRLICFSTCYQRTFISLSSFFITLSATFQFTNLFQTINTGIRLAEARSIATHQPTPTITMPPATTKKKAASKKTKRRKDPPTAATGEGTDAPLAKKKKGKKKGIAWGSVDDPCKELLKI